MYWRQIAAAEVEFGVVQFEQRPRVDETASESHVVAHGIGDQGADAEGVAFRVDALDHQEFVVVVGVGRVGRRAAEDPLSFGDEQVVGVGESAFAAHFVDCLRNRAGRIGVRGCFLCAQGLRRGREAQREDERADE